ncbi:MAG: hypothetical protein NW208_19235 [Bryobacter sp.]|nr:hypothetical protein [Bryobacter sp.]
MNTWLKQLRPLFATPEPLDLVQTLTLVLLMFQAPLDWYGRIPMVMLGVAGLAMPALRRQGGFWFLLAAIWLGWTVRNWATADNHKWLSGYWCLAMGTACFYGDRALVVLQRNARYMIAFAFLFATLAKVVSPTYVTNAFFEYTTLADNRFHGYGHTMKLMSPQQTAQNEKAILAVAGPAPSAASRTLEASPWLRPASLVLTWWTVFIELLIGVVFLFPLNRWRDPSLLLFLVTTYTITTVVGFGWLLALMAMTLSPRRGWYVLAIILIEAYEAPLTWFLRFLPSF